LGNRASGIARWSSDFDFDLDFGLVGSVASYIGLDYLSVVDEVGIWWARVIGYDNAMRIWTMLMSDTAVVWWYLVWLWVAISAHVVPAGLSKATDLIPRFRQKLEVLRLYHKSRQR